MQVGDPNPAVFRITAQPNRSEHHMLGLDNPIHLLFLLGVLLLVFGAKRLPEIGRSLGSGLRGFKESISGETTPAQVNELTPSDRA
jgi:sec-independent protein translocase protein TatA